MPYITPFKDGNSKKIAEALLKKEEELRKNKPKSWILSKYRNLGLYKNDKIEKEAQELKKLFKKKK